MVAAASPLIGIAVALGVGLLAGVERERRKGEGPGRGAAGLRSFALATLGGALAFLAGGPGVLAAMVAAIGLLAGVAYWRTRSDDPGITTEIALVAMVLVGGLSAAHPAEGAIAGIVVAILLAARNPLHRFVRRVLSEDEIRDALIFAAAILIVLPLLPDRDMGPYGALNPRKIWTVVVLVLAIGAAGHVAVRLLGPRYGLPLAGLASGFISSTATIGAMGQTAKQEPELRLAAIAAAVLSTLATMLQMALLVGAISPPVLERIALPLAFGAAAAAAYGLIAVGLALRRTKDVATEPGRAFSLRAALLFAGALALIMVASAGLSARFGEAGLVAAAGVAGFVDAHAAAVSVASLSASMKLTADAAVIPILAGLTTNAVSKAVVALTAGGRAYALRVAPGLLLTAAAVWIGALVQGSLRLPA